MNLRICRAMPAMTLLLLLMTPSARATYRADFFAAARRPTISFDKAHLTWTLRNGAIERVIRYDPKAGSLRTVALRDLRTHHLLQAAPGGEGEISFVAPLLDPPTPLTSWNMTDRPPPSDWAQPGFDDSAWKQITLPFKTDVENKTWWFRARLPAAKLQAGHAYALCFDRAIDDAADIYVDGALAQQVNAAEQPYNHMVQVDLLPTSRVVAVKLVGKGKPNGLVGTVSLAQVGTAPPSVSLDHDWLYSVQSINTGENNSQILTLSLDGTKQYEGFNLDVNYQISAGDEPTIAKWFNFTSHRQTRFLVEKVVYDRWLAPGSHPQTMAFAGTGFVAVDPLTQDGLLTAVLSPQGMSEWNADTGRVAPMIWSYDPVKPDVPLQLPKSLTGFCHGPPAKGAFLYQLYIGQYVAHATPTSVPALYNTWFGYGEGINAAICARIIPLAADLGVKLFVIDSGWETNTAPGTGSYGDWIVDRRPDKFPEGLLPISDLVQEHNMRFGLWEAPILVSTGSQEASEHHDWLLEQAGGTPVAEWEGTYGMCFASPWANNWGDSTLQLCRQLSVSFLKLDAGLIYPSCMAPDHDHPIGHSEESQLAQWKAFCDKMRQLDPAFIIDRGWDDGPEWTADQDEGWFGDWEIGYDPKRQADPRWWYKNADIYRSRLYDLTWTRPPFTIAWETPCHIPTSPPDLNALEYHFTSIGAYVCNVELHGKLDQMTPQERSLVRKWVQWNTDNRPWLAFTQPIASLGKPWDPRDPHAQPHIDGVLHLRNVLKGRYGYLCLWNPADTPGRAAVSFDPSDYFVHMNLGKLEIVRYKDNRTVPFEVRNGAVTLKDIAMPPLSWEIYELRLR